LLGVSSAKSVLNFSSKINFEIKNKNMFFFSYLEGFDDVSVKILANTSKSYQQYDEAVLKQIDREFYKNLTIKPGFFTADTEAYEFYEEIPYEINIELNTLLYLEVDWSHYLEFWQRVATYYIVSSFYYEPHFFLWEKIEQTMEEFRFICHFREWALLLDDRIFNPTVKFNDPKHMTPLLSHLAQKSELKSGFKIVKKLFDYKKYQLFAYYLDYEDVQVYAFDKNFLHLWNYWIGLWHELNWFSYWGWTGLLNFWREKIYTPRVHIPSKYYWTDLGYFSNSVHSLQFAFFPDTAMLWGHLNPHLDWLTWGHNRFFHFGDNYMDSLLSLELIRHQISINYWGDFESLVEDYSMYQPTYFSDTVASIWIPIILLLAKDSYKSFGEMNMYINDYNAVFHFKTQKIYKKLLKGSVLFELDCYERLEKLWDAVPMTQRPINIERHINMLYAYNFPSLIINQPSWLTWMTDINWFYNATVYDNVEDVKSEEFVKKIIKSSASYSTHKYPISIYFSNNNVPYDLKNVFNYINEKLFDDPAYFSTGLNRTENSFKFEHFSWRKQISFFYTELLPAPHYTWRLFIFDRLIFDWNFIFLVQNFDSLQAFFEAVDQTFSLSFWQHHFFSLQPTFKKENPIYQIPIHCNLVLQFTVEPHHLVRFFWETFDFYYVDKFFYPLSFLMQQAISFLGHSYGFVNTETFKTSIASTKINFMGHEILAVGLLNFDFLPTKTKKIILFLADMFADFFLRHNIGFLSIELYEYTDNSLRVAVLASADFSVKLLPIEFFLPFLKYPEEFYGTLDRKLMTMKNQTPFIPGSAPIKINNINDVERLILFYGVLDLNKKENEWRLLREHVLAYNRVELKLLKRSWLEYDRYLNYVKKHSTYKRP
jgi:hypothetical protein